MKLSILSAVILISISAGKAFGCGTFTVTSCDYSFTKGQRYLVYAYGSLTEMKTHQCSRTSLIKYAEKEMQGLDEIMPPVKMNEEPVTRISDPSTTHKVTITFTGTVKSVEMLGERELKVIPVDFDSRFAVTVHIESVSPKEVPLKANTDQNFAIHSPAQLFQAAKEDAIGKKYRFNVVWNGIGSNSRLSELSAVRIVDE